MEYEIGKRLRAARKRLGKTQAAFAHEIGLSDVTISTTESGKTPLTEANSKLICLYYGINDQWLLDGDGEMFTRPLQSTGEEALLLDMFCRLSPEMRAFILKKVRELLKEDKEKWGRETDGVNTPFQKEEDESPPEKGEEDSGLSPQKAAG
jgi:transcriptional regulator with XRE-family HTH domain